MFGLDLNTSVACHEMIMNYRCGGERYNARMVEVESEVIRHALQTAREHGFRTVHLESGDLKFKATLNLTPSEDQEGEGDVSVSDVAAVNMATTVAVTAPCVGYFNFAKKPVRSGDKVEAGAVVGSVVAVGLQNEVVCGCAGKVTQLFVAEGDAVEYGQPILEIEAAP